MDTHATLQTNILPNKFFQIVKIMNMCAQHIGLVKCSGFCFLATLHKKSFLLIKFTECKGKKKHKKTEEKKKKMRQTYKLWLFVTFVSVFFFVCFGVGRCSCKDFHLKKNHTVRIWCMMIFILQWICFVFNAFCITSHRISSNRFIIIRKLACVLFFYSFVIRSACAVHLKCVWPLCFSIDCEHFYTMTKSKRKREREREE